MVFLAHFHQECKSFWKWLYDAEIYKQLADGGAPLSDPKNIWLKTQKGYLFSNRSS